MERDIKSNFNFKSAKERVSKVINKTELIKSDYSMLGRRVGSYEVDGRRLVDGKLGQTCVRVSIEFPLGVAGWYYVLLGRGKNQEILAQIATFASS